MGLPLYRLSYRGTRPLMPILTSFCCCALPVQMWMGCIASCKSHLLRHIVWEQLMSEQSLESVIPVDVETFYQRDKTFDLRCIRAKIGATCHSKSSSRQHVAHLIAMEPSNCMKNGPFVFPLLHLLFWIIIFKIVSQCQHFAQRKTEDNKGCRLVSYR